EAAHETAEEIERGTPQHERQEKESPLGAPNRQGLVDGFVNRMEPGFSGHNVSLVAAVRGTLREKPGHEIHGPDRHPDAENDAGEHPLGLSFAKSKHKAAHHDGDQAEAPGNRTGKSGL